MQPLTAQEKVGRAADVYVGNAVFEVSHHGRSDARCESDCAKLPAGGERLKPDWTFRWLLDPAQISPGTAMPSGLFRKEGDRWVLTCRIRRRARTTITRSRAVAGSLHVLMTPDEQRQLLATSPVKPAAVTNTQAQRKVRKKQGEDLARRVRKNRLTVARIARRSNTHAPGM
jgi:hypothetical protein